MRQTRTLIVLAMALMACACAREAPRYVAIDPQTGQQLGVVPSPGPSPTQAMASADSSGWFSSGGRSRGADSRGLFGGEAQPQQEAQATYPPQIIQAPGPATANPAYAPTPVPMARAPAPRSYAPPRQTYQPAPVYQQPQQSYAQTYAQAPAGPAGYQAYASAPAAYQETYTLDTGDKLRVVVFGQDGLTSQYTVDAGGNVTLPLIGPVPARGQSTTHLANDIAARLKQGYVRDPKVTVEVEAYRPFFILGEVTTPGQYPYTPNMTAETAIAIAGGFAPRASKNAVKVTRNIPGQQFSGDVPLNFQLKPGDTVLVKERWF
jgi:polysaccharide export outer membrane protein